MMDEGEKEDWLEKNYAPSDANRDVVRGPAGQAFSKQGIDPRNLLEDESFGESSRLFNRMVAPYKKAAEAVGDITWEGVHSVSREAGNAMVTGLGKAAQGFIDLAGELGETVDAHRSGREVHPQCEGFCGVHDLQEAGGEQLLRHLFERRNQPGMVGRYPPPEAVTPGHHAKGSQVRLG